MTCVNSRLGAYYDPATGQFLSVDPLVDETGQPYAYTGDDPVNGVDPARTLMSQLALTEPAQQSQVRPCGWQLHAMFSCSRRQSQTATYSATGGALRPSPAVFVLPIVGLITGGRSLSARIRTACANLSC